MLWHTFPLAMCWHLTHNQNNDPVPRSEDRETLEMYRSFVELAPDAILLGNSEGIIYRVNQ